MNEQTRKPMTRQQRQFRRIMTTIAVVALFSLLVGMLIGVLIGFSFRSTDKQTDEAKEPLITTTAYASDTTYTAEPTVYEAEVWNDLGEFTCYAYDACSECCGKTDGITKSGKIAKANRTIAVDPSVIPLGSIVEIDGARYVAEDTGGGIKGNIIDIFFSTHDEAVEYGKQTHKVKVLN